MLQTIGYLYVIQYYGGFHIPLLDFGLIKRSLGDSNLPKLWPNGTVLELSTEVSANLKRHLYQLFEPSTAIIL